MRLQANSDSSASQGSAQLLALLEFPDPRLRTRAKAVAEVDGQLAQLADRMLETMYAAPGIGLAATQVNVHQQLLVLDVSEVRNRPLVLVNPEITQAEGTVESAEGCLSIPGFFEPVTRHARIQVSAVGRDGEPFTMEADGLLGICIQHEMDHLQGKLFVDYLSSAKRQLIRRRLQKRQRLKG